MNNLVTEYKFREDRILERVPIHCWIKKEDVKGLYVWVGDRKIRIDRRGLRLFLRYRNYWRINYSHFYLHRFPFFENGGRIELGHNKVVAFHREVLHLHNKTNQVHFINGDTLDCRLVNLDSDVFIKHYDLDCWDD